MFNRIRNWPNEPGPKGYPQKLGRFQITGIRDLTVGYDDHYPDLKPVILIQLHTNVNHFLLLFSIKVELGLTLRSGIYISFAECI